SGSAAAVAAGFVSFAFGTQTAGSTIRPASYCGLTGYKPSYGLLPLDGVQPISTTLDHLGIFARSPRDAWYLTSAMMMPAPEVVSARAAAHPCVDAACPGRIRGAHESACGLACARRDRSRDAGSAVRGRGLQGTATGALLLGGRAHSARARAGAG